MKVVLYTNFKGLTSTANGMISGLEELGHDVHVINHKVLKKNKQNDFEEVIRKSENADTILVTKGHWINKDKLKELCNIRDVTLFSQDSITVGPPGREEQIGSRALLASRVIMTGYEGCAWLRNAGYRGRIAQIYQGYRPEYWRENEKVSPKSQLVFLGTNYSGDGGRGKKLKAIKEAGFSILINKRIFLDKASQLYCNTPISINFNCGDLTSNRVLRILASGGFCLTQPNADIKASFQNGRELSWWDAGDSFQIEVSNMLESISYWLENPKKREEIIERGKAWASTRTWTHQMEKHVKFIKGEDVEADGAASPYVGSYKETS